MSSVLAGLASVFGAAFVAVGFSATSINWHYVIGGAVSALAGVVFPKDGLLWEVLDYRKRLRGYREVLSYQERLLEEADLKVKRLVEQLESRLGKVNYDTADLVGKLLELEVYSEETLWVLARSLAHAASVDRSMVTQLVWRFKTASMPFAALVATTEMLLKACSCECDNAAVQEMASEVAAQLRFAIDSESLTMDVAKACHILATDHDTLPQRQNIFHELNRYAEAVRADIKVRKLRTAKKKRN